MKLRKDKWIEESLGTVAIKLTDGAHNVPKALQSGYPMISARDIQDYKIDLSNPRFISLENFERENKRTNVQENDILLTIVGTIGRCAIIPNNFKRFTMQRSVAVIRTNQHPQYILAYIDSPKFQAQLLKKAIGTAQKGVYLKSLSETKVLLPPLEEQIQIASLFQSIETTIELVDGQVKILKMLLQRLTNGLLKKDPEFGELLNIKNCNYTKFGNLTDCIEQHDKQKIGLTRFIGLEDIQPDNFKIETWGNIEKGTTFTKCFLKGDVLFGKRRAYLKKVAVPDFDGICSGDILVLRAKKDKILPELLQFYIASEAFIQHAVKTSAGSLSPRTKWKDLKELELSIPDLKTQEVILLILKQLQDANSHLRQQKTNLNNLKQKLLNEILS